jgi:hypothetical protein
LAEFEEFSFDPSRHQCERLAEATEGVPIDYRVIPPFVWRTSSNRRSPCGRRDSGGSGHQPIFLHDPSVARRDISGPRYWKAPQTRGFSFEALCEFAAVGRKMPPRNGLTGSFSALQSLM